jgi:hypothetical protein
MRDVMRLLRRSTGESESKNGLGRGHRREKKFLLGEGMKARRWKTGGACSPNRRGKRLKRRFVEA